MEPWKPGMVWLNEGDRKPILGNPDGLEALDQNALLEWFEHIEAQESFPELLERSPEMGKLWNEENPTSP